MNSDSNREIDLLLRRHGRRKAIAASDEAAQKSTATASAGPHMDADEMNAYAERELPEAARARVLVHLADCDQCRAIVTELTLAANVAIKAAEQETQQAEAPRTSWLAWLAALFAPPVMRYATAAIVLLCVVGVAFLVMRQRKAERQAEDGTLVAQNNESAGQNPSALRPETAEAPAQQAANASTGAQSNTARDNKSVTPAGPVDGEAAKREATLNEAQPAPVARTDEQASTVTPAPPKEAAPELSARDRQRDQDFAVNTTPARPPATLTPSVAGTRPEQPATEADKIKQNRKDDAPTDTRLSKDGAAANTAAGTATTRERETEESVAVGRQESAPATRRRAARKPEAKSRGADVAGSSSAIVDGTSSDTRSVGSRQFKRQGSAWVDTAYSAGRATVNVSRGSEQYRALAADEPGLRAIAEQLGGEVIVVWKGRAYRIR